MMACRSPLYADASLVLVLRSPIHPHWEHAPDWEPSFAACFVPLRLPRLVSRLEADRVPWQRTGLVMPQTDARRSPRNPKAALGGHRSLWLSISGSWLGSVSIGPEWPCVGGS